MKKYLVIVAAIATALWITPENSYAQDSTTSSICINVYNDLDGKGTFDADESLVNGAFVQIYDSTGHKVAWYTTDALYDPLCTQLEPGQYRVTVKVPDGFKPTTKNEFEFQLPEAATANLDFGVQRKVNPPDNASLANTDLDNTTQDSLFIVTFSLVLICESLCVGMVFGGAVVWGIGHIRHRSTLPPA